MLIDWFTVLAQIVNFLILAALLKYFLFDRIVKAMDEREQKIASRFEEARQKEEDAEKERLEYGDKKTDIENEKDQILVDARRRAEEEREDMVGRARSEVEEKRNDWLRSLRSEREDFNRELAATVSEQVMAIGRESLARLMDADLEARLVESFLRELDELDSEDLAGDFDDDGEEKNVLARVRSAFPMGDDGRRKIREAVGEKVGARTEVSFEQSPEVIAGVELSVGGRRAGLTLAGYFDELEREVMGRIGRRAGEGPGGDEKEEGRQEA